jgi:hypothetical protein
VTTSSSSPPRDGEDGGTRALCYERFLRAVVSRQLRAWLPATSVRILDISRDDPARGSCSVSSTMARAGHHVIRVENPTCPDRIAAPSAPGAPNAPSAPSAPSAAGSGRSAVTRVFGDTRSLDWFRSGTLAAVVAEGSALSSCLATETTVDQAARLLRPGGRLLLSVDSLLHGLALLAEQHRWPELADAGSGDVVLIPAGDDSYTRCFGPTELGELVQDAGFDIDFIRPRTVIPPDVVSHALANDPGVFAELVTSELGLAAERQGEAAGMYLTLSATRRA